MKCNHMMGRPALTEAAVDHVTTLANKWDIPPPRSTTEQDLQQTQLPRSSSADRTQVAVRAAVPDEGVVGAREARVMGRVHRLHAAEQRRQAVEGVALDRGGLRAHGTVCHKSWAEARTSGTSSHT